jgi:two-component system, NarL family, response regulator NreC
MAPTIAKSVLIADDNASIRQALCGLFEGEVDFEVCGEAENGKVAIEKAGELHPDLIVLDLSIACDERT